MKTINILKSIARKWRWFWGTHYKVVDKNGKVITIILVYRKKIWVNEYEKKR